METITPSLWTRVGLGGETEVIRQAPDRRPTGATHCLLPLLLTLVVGGRQVLSKGLLLGFTDRDEGGGGL